MPRGREDESKMPDGQWGLGTGCRGRAAGTVCEPLATDNYGAGMAGGFSLEGDRTEGVRATTSALGTGEHLDLWKARGGKKLGWA